VGQRYGVPLANTVTESLTRGCDKLAVDGVLPSLAPAVAGHLVAPEVRHFAYDALDDAVAWAGAADTNGAGRA
jgi:hypothetical protein